MNTDLTIAIATCGRPRILNRCIRSIYKHTKKDVNITVLDNVGAFTDYKYAKPRGIANSTNMIYIDDRKIGCCESNNILADSCETKYIMHMDDDVYINDNNNGIIDDMYKWIKSVGSNTIIGGCWYDTFYGGMRPSNMKYLKSGNTIKKIPTEYKPFKGLKSTDECLHSMIMDKDAIYSKVRWDEHYKWKGDRFDFFLQCADKDIDLYTFGDKHFIHDPQPFKYGSMSYEDFGGKEAIAYFTKKWGMTPLVGWDRQQIKPGNI